MKLARPTWGRSLFLGLVAYGLSATASIAAPLYTITDLGVLPGDEGSTAADINARGQIVGTSWNASTGAQRSFLYENGVMKVIEPMGGGPANAINDAGQVVGGSIVSINNSGQSVSVDQPLHGTLISTGVWSGVDILLRPSAINDSGDVVGSIAVTTGSMNVSLDPAIERNGQVFDFNTLLQQNIRSASAFAINNRGDVLVSYVVRGGGETPHFALLNHDGTMRDLTSLAPGRWDGGALNNLGQVVGPNYLYSDGQVYALSALLPSSSRWDDLVPRAINDAGQIVGSGQIDGQSHAFLMTPVPPPAVPEPSTIAVFGLASCWYLRRRSRNVRQA